MRFLDTNIFIYAYYKPKRHITLKEKQMKEQAKKIIADVSQGKEEVVTTVVHISEVANILKHRIPKDELETIIRGLFMLDNVEITDATRNSYFAAIELGEDLKLEINDAFAVDVMRLNGIDEIYSFDKDFNQIEGIRRLPEI
jgi:predicted nucleic acid-binding protein